MNEIAKILSSGDAETILRASALPTRAKDIVALWQQAFAMYEDNREISSLAAYHLGFHYRKGLGVSIDKEKALAMFKRTAACDGVFQVYAMRIVSNMYFSGEGTEKNPVEALRWIRLAEKHGYVATAAELEEICREIPIDVMGMTQNPVAEVDASV